jgi:7-cyano-7-deazaguanine reductase
VTIRYVPRAKCIETKSLKLYLWSFRDRGAFAEALAVELADAIHEATGGADTAVRLQQGVRGGIFTTVYATRGEGLWSW